MKPKEKPEIQTLGAVKQLKRSTSKNQLARGVLRLVEVLKLYASEESWVVKGEDIVWIASDDPTRAAREVLKIK